MRADYRRSSPAVGTEAVNFQLVAPDHKTVPRGNLVLQLFDGLVLELDDRVAAGTDQMIMVFAGQDMLVARLSVVQQNLAGQTGLYKQLEGAVDRGLPDPGIAGLDLQIQFFDTDVLVGGEEYIKDDCRAGGWNADPCWRQNR